MKDLLPPWSERREDQQEVDAGSFLRHFWSCPVFPNTSASRIFNPHVDSTSGCMRTRDVLQGFRHAVAPVPFGGFLYLQGNSMVSAKNFRIRLCRSAEQDPVVRLGARGQEGSVFRFLLQKGENWFIGEN